MVGRFKAIARRLRRKLLLPAYWRDQASAAQSVVPLGTPPPDAKLRALFLQGPTTDLPDPGLARLLGPVTLGFWTIDSSSLWWLCRQVRERKPTAILELGSGISTIAFASVMRELYGMGTPRVYSVEQDAEQTATTQSRLAAAGLAGMAKVLHAPLVEQTIEQQDVLCYELGSAALAGFLGDIRPDFTFVDGPAAPGHPDVRFGTLPLVKEHVVAGSPFWLHDGFRPEETEVANRWAALRYLNVVGLRPIGAGLIEGHFTHVDRA